MKKDAIIDLLINDLREMQTLSETFREPDRIAKEFIELLEQKNASIAREIKLLLYWSSENIEGEVDAMQDAPKATTRAASETNEPHFEIPTYIPKEEPVAAEASMPKTSNTESSIEKQPQKESNIDIRQQSQPIPSQPRPQQSRPENMGHRGGFPQQPHGDNTPHRQMHAEQAARQHQASASDIANYGTPVSDLNKAFGLNDKFLFLRELFSGDRQSFDSTVQAINASKTFQQAYQYLKVNYHWDESSPVTEAFLKAVHRRFL